MTTTLSAKGYFARTAEYDTRSWHVLLPEGVAYADLFRPEFWMHHATKLRQHDLIRVRAADGAFDVMLNVVMTTRGGTLVEEWPKWPTEADNDAAKNAVAEPIAVREVYGRPVPRVEHTPKTKWRVIGLDGSEISREHPTKDAAETALRQYVAAMGKTLADV